MGVVDAARDDQLERNVALKLLSHSSRSPVAREGLDHPNIATVHEVGNYGGGVFVAMELIEGPSLAAWLAEEHDWAERLRMLVAAGEGLAAGSGSPWWSVTAPARTGLAYRDFANSLMGMPLAPSLRTDAQREQYCKTLADQAALVRARATETLAYCESKSGSAGLDPKRCSTPELVAPE